MLLEKKKKRDQEIPTGSMADIAFLLLIFFLVTTTMDTDKGIPMVLPEHGGEAKINPKNIAKILINATGDVLFDNEIIDDAELRDRLDIRLRERGNDAEGKPKLIVSIKTDRETEYERYIAILDIVKGSGATKISIAEPDRD
ncbi:MAG: biopolymer transporter ExbD [Candidatus Electryoneaceae bacterium]|nr:biopolymer transporter ExbD [Candidatus Electryoneaceae bacterium]